MGNIFSGSEIVEIGIQIEKNGKDFYDTLAQNSKDPEAVKLFKYLSAEEEKHIHVFVKILDSLEGYAPAESYPGEYINYMQALAGEYVFTRKDKGAEIAKAVKDDRQAIDMGIGFEKDSIIFYEGMKKSVPDFDLKIVDALIMQEQGHLRQLVEMKEKVS